MQQSKLQVLAQFPVAASKMELDYYQQKVNASIACKILISKKLKLKSKS